MQTVKTIARKTLHMAVAILAGIAAFITAIILFNVGLIAVIYNKLEYRQKRITNAN